VDVVDVVQLQHTARAAVAWLQTIRSIPTFLRPSFNDSTNVTVLPSASATWSWRSGRRHRLRGDGREGHQAAEDDDDCDALHDFS
jgi:hypothetical protein